jgi:hypothetical protein
MATTAERLQSLRRWFVIYYAFNLFVGTWASVVVVDAIRMSSLPYARSLERIPAGLVIAFSLLVGGAVFGVALVLFQQLLLRKNWARVVMLIIAWLSAVSSGINVFTSCALFSPSGWLLQILPEANWGIIGLTNVTTNVASLVFSIYMIRTIQFDQQVRAEFITAPQT